MGGIEKENFGEIMLKWKEQFDEGIALCQGALNRTDSLLHELTHSANSFNDGVKQCMDISSSLQLGEE